MKMRNRFAQLMRSILPALALVSFALVIIIYLCFYSDDISNQNVKFSHEAGFYNKQFMLTLSAPKGTEIYYTLDGSIPNRNSIHYDAPISVENVTSNKNTISMREDTTFEKSGGC